MPGTYGKTADSIDKYRYVGLDGITYWIKCRYTLSGGLTPGSIPAGASRFPGRPSHVRIRCVDDNGKLHHKNLPYDRANSPSNAFTNLPGTVDGLTGWVEGGHSGEKVRR